MKYSLTDFKGRFHTIPNVLLDFLPCDMYMVLAQIYVASRDVLYDGKIKVSRNRLIKTSGLNRRTVVKCIERLTQLNLLSSVSLNQKTVFYTINWEEVYAIEQFCKTINFDGECVIRDKCISQNNCIPFSTIDERELENITKSYQYYCEEDEVETEDAQNTETLEECVQNTETQPDISAFHAKNKEKMAQNAEIIKESDGNAETTEDISVFRAHPEKDFGILNTHPHDIVKTEEGYVLMVGLTKAEKLLLERIGMDSLKVKLTDISAFHARFNEISAFLTTSVSLLRENWHEMPKYFSESAQNAETAEEVFSTDENESEEVVQNAETMKNLARNAETCVQNADNKIYNKIYAKRSFAKEKINKKEIEEDFLKDFFDSRNLELPAFDKILREDFLQKDLDDDDDDVIKTIKHVWGQLDYDEELPDNNFIDLRTFHNILAHSWEYLKSTYADYSLSEDETKNIFGFLVIEHEGEPCLYIDPSKLQDIHATETRTSRRKSREGKFTDRTSRRFFVEAIKEIADKNDELLTDAEYAILLMMDYVEENKRGNLPVEVPKLFYRELLKDFSERSKVPVEDLQALFQDLPQKDKVKLSPMQLSPDRFFEYNSSKGQESEVEKLLKEKLAEQD